jgi:drug/metabolite transporter (DMT)-like permease
MALDPHRKGFAFALVAAILWASCAVVGKGLFALGITPAALVQARCTLGVVALGIGLALYDRRLFAVSRRDLAGLALLGGVLLAALQTFYFTAVKLIQVAAAILLQYSSTFIVLVVAVTFLGERLTRGKAACFGVAVVGCFLVAGGYDVKLALLNGPGITYGLAGAVSFAAYTLLGVRLMRRLQPVTVLFYALLFAAVSLNAVAPPLGFAPYLARDPLTASKLVYVALCGTVAPFGLYFAAVQRIGASKASIVATSEPVFSAVLAYLALGELFAAPQMIGAACVIGAIIALERQRGA